MNRRNFLKLFGLLAVPTSAIGSRFIKTPPSVVQMKQRKKKREINLYITLENRFNETHGKHRIIIRKKLKSDHYEEHYRYKDVGDWTDTFLVHGRCVEADDLVTIEVQDGTSVSFTPTPNPYQEGKFEAMNITTELNGWNYKNGLNYKLEATLIL